jgi:hypothetical protein
VVEVEMPSSSMSRRDGGAFRRAGLTVALALAALAALPAVASASTVSTDGATITFAAAAGETNGVTVTVVGTNYRFADGPGPDPTAGAGCSDTGATVDCPLDPSTAVTVNLGNGDDTFTAAGVNQDPFTINGDDGDDGNITGSDADDRINGGDADDEATATGLSGGPGNDTIDGSDGTSGDGSTGEIINGGDGNDILFGGTEGHDDLFGGNGNDRLDGGQGDFDDDYDGGAGIDRVVYGIIPGFTYTCTAQAVRVTMDNNDNDRSCADSSADDQTVRDSVESVTGSTLGDMITGSCFANTFAGDPGSASGDAGGNDTLNGDPTAGCTSAAGSTDFLGGLEGNDTFNGDGLIDATHFRGFDTVTYGFPLTGGGGISVDLDDVADDNDGFGNTADNVNGDIERVIGNSGADTINATDADQGVNLFGRAGGDTLTGSSTFGDFLDGEGDVDSLTCLGGLDTYRDNENEDAVAADCETEI